METDKMTDSKEFIVNAVRKELPYKFDTVKHYVTGKKWGYLHGQQFPKRLKPYLKLFTNLFYDHPSSDNCYVVVSFWDTTESYQMYWICTHFEDHTIETLTGISTFLLKLAGEYGCEMGGPYLELLNSNYELLIIGLAGIDPIDGRHLIKKMKSLNQYLEELN